MITRLMTMFPAFFLTLSPVFADGQFNVNIVNEESVTLLVSVTDMNSPSPVRGGVFNGALESGKQRSEQISGASGDGHVEWSASTSDRQKCGSGEYTHLDAGGEVKISTPSSC